MGLKLSDVQEAANRAADDIIAALELPDEGKRDCVNLVVNATLYYLDGNPDATLADAIRDRYQEEPARVLEWCQS